MAAAPDDDARRTLAELEAKLRELERELLRGYEPGTVESDPFAAPAEPDLAPPAALRPDEPAPEPPIPPGPFDRPERTVPEPPAGVPVFEPEPVDEAPPEPARVEAS